MSLRLEIAQQLRRAKETEERFQRDLAKAVGCSEANLSTKLSTGRTLTFEQIEAIAADLGYSVKFVVEKL